MCFSADYSEPKLISFSYAEKILHYCENPAFVQRQKSFSQINIQFFSYNSISFLYDQLMRTEQNESYLTK